MGDSGRSPGAATPEGGSEGVADLITSEPSALHFGFSFCIARFNVISSHVSIHPAFVVLHGNEANTSSLPLSDAGSEAHALNSAIESAPTSRACSFSVRGCDAMWHRAPIAGIHFVHRHRVCI